MATELQKEIQRCAKSFDYFCRYLQIVDKKSHLIKMEPKPAQAEFLRDLDANPWTYVLKARQLGITTIVAAKFFWMALFKPNHKVLVIAHNADSARVIFEVYKRFYDYLPPFLKFPLEKSNVREMLFFHGGLIRVGTANSESFRGATYQSIHCSEFAFWGDPEKTIAAAFQTAGPNADIVLETTANGINDAHRMWRDDNGFSKRFYGWTKDPEYIRKKKPDAFNPKIEEYAEEFELTREQHFWAQQTYRTKCGANWNTFLQEYPLDPEHAFITSGERFFSHIFPHAQAAPGYRCMGEKKPYNVYSMGVDTASGSPSGDYSAFCVMDVTDKKRPVVVATFYDRISPAGFAARALVELKKWDALAVVESNTYGLSVLEYLMSHEWAYMFRRTQYDKMAERWLERVGFNTNVNTRPVMLSRLHEFISKDWITVNDERMKAEMNTFVYNERGKPEASSKKHDDMIFAWALALMGLDQLEPVRAEVQAKKPSTLAEVLQFERATGKVYASHADEQGKDLWGTPYEQSSLIDTALNDPPAQA